MSLKTQETLKRQVGLGASVQNMGTEVLISLSDSPLLPSCSLQPPLCQRHLKMFIFGVALMHELKLNIQLCIFPHASNMFRTHPGRILSHWRCADLSVKPIL